MPIYTIIMQNQYTNETLVCKGEAEDPNTAFSYAAKSFLGDSGSAREDLFLIAALKGDHLVFYPDAGNKSPVAIMDYPT